MLFRTHKIGVEPHWRHDRRLLASVRQESDGGRGKSSTANYNIPSIATLSLEDNVFSSPGPLLPDVALRKASCENDAVVGGRRIEILKR